MMYNKYRLFPNKNIGCLYYRIGAVPKHLCIYEQKVLDSLIGKEKLLDNLVNVSI